MSEAASDELTAEVLAELRTRLERKRGELRSTLAREDEQVSLGGAADIVGDEADASVDLQEVDIEAVAAADLRADLADVEHALAKMDAGTYGWCEECSRPIPLARLRAIPEARYDAQHAAEIEQRTNPQ
jgi:RNA polymerase-binding transcription factor DksA